MHDPIQKVIKSKKLSFLLGGVAQVVELQPSKLQDPSSNHCTTNQKKRKKKER
jgi:hypothetical protein